MPQPPSPQTLSFWRHTVRAQPRKSARAGTTTRAGLLLVEDDLGIYRLRGSTATLWAGPDLHPALADLEGVTANDAGDVARMSLPS